MVQPGGPVFATTGAGASGAGGGWLNLLLPLPFNSLGSREKPRCSRRNVPPVPAPPRERGSSACLRAVGPGLAGINGAGSTGAPPLLMYDSSAPAPAEREGKMKNPTTRDAAITPTTKEAAVQHLLDEGGARRSMGAGR
mmetsp:Transcript_11633/g.36844  ORF Transcript_11633/g.36844 Transcript_11633/m.36844 type:complete len:139 (+) Transcript_11633:879-1295(+)